MELTKNDALSSAILACISFGIYCNSLGADFVYDDSRAIINNDDLRPDTSWWNVLINDYWGTPLAHSGSHKSYRPLTVATFRLNYYFYQLQPFSYHLVNVVLHTVVCLQVWLLTVMLNLKRETGFLTGLLFALHPIHTEAVCGIVGRADLLASVFFLTAFMVYMVHLAKSAENSSNYGYLALCILCTVAGMLSKEHALTVLGVCLVYDVFVHSRIPLPQLTRVLTEAHYGKLRHRILVLVSTGFGCLLFRLWIMDFQAPKFSESDNPAAHSSYFFTRLLTFLYLPVVNLKLLILPLVLSFDWSMGTIPLVKSVWDVRLVEILVLYGLMVKLLKVTLSRLKTFGNMPKDGQSRAPSPYDLNANRLSISNNGSDSRFMQISPNGSAYPNNGGVRIMQISDLNYPAGISERGSYANTCTVPKCFGNLPQTKNGYRQKFKGKPITLDKWQDLMQIRKTRQQPTLLGISLMLLTFIPATNLLSYVGFVVAERVLYLPSVGYCIIIASGWDNLHSFLETCQHFHSGKLKKTLRILLNFAFCTLLLAFATKTWLRNRDWQSEEALYRSGIPINPAKSYSNLGNVLTKASRLEEAEKSYRKALEHRPNMADTHYNLGTLLQESGRLEEAASAYQNAIQCRSRLAVAYLNLGLAFWSLKKIDSAQKTFEDCSHLSNEGLKDPKSHDNAKTSCLYNLGRLLAERGQFSAAISIYRNAIEWMSNLYPAAHSLYNMLGEAYAKNGDFHPAEQWFKKALSLKPDHVPAHLTYGHLMLKKGEKEAALLWFQKAIQLSPHDSTTLQHLGQFYQQTNQMEKALKVYQDAYRLDRTQFETVFALASLHRLLGQKELAEEFYQISAQLSPDSASAHLNYGAMLHLNKKFEKAQAQYQIALKLNPADHLTLENLHKLERSMGV